MKILITGINFSPELTGIGKYTGELADYLASAGHELRVVTAPPYYPQWRVLPGYSGWRYQREYVKSMVIYRCPLWVPLRPRGFSRILHLASFAFSNLWPMLVLSAWKPDVVISVAPTILSAPAALLAARLAGAKAWLHIQDFELEAATSLGILPPLPWMKAFAGMMESWLYQQFDCVSSLSESMLERLAKKGVPESSLVMLPNWVDTQFIRHISGSNRLRAEWGIEQDHIVVLYAGNLGFKQGLGQLINAAKQITDPRIRFVLCGDGASRAELQEQGKVLPNIMFLPLQPYQRLNELLNLADIHVLPQLPEAADLVMPSKLTGMLASGKPVIVTAESGTEMYAIVSRVGLVVPPGNPLQLATAIQHLAANQSKRACLGSMGRDYAERNWEKEIILPKYLRQLEFILTGNSKK